MSDEFPRPCKNCGNQVMMHKGKLVHVYRKRAECHTFRQYSIVRDSQGMPIRMDWLGDVPIPDPVAKQQIAEQKLKEWNELYEG